MGGGHNAARGIAGASPPPIPANAEPPLVVTGSSAGGVGRGGSERLTAAGVGGQVVGGGVPEKPAAAHTSAPSMRWAVRHNATRAVSHQGLAVPAGIGGLSQPEGDAPRGDRHGGRGCGTGWGARALWESESCVRE